MPFTMARSSFDHRVVISDTRFLRSFWNTINVGAECNHGLATAPRCKPCRGNVCNALLYFETVLFENTCEIRLCFNFLEAELRKTEKHVVDLLTKHGILFNFFCHLGLEFLGNL